METIDPPLWSKTIIGFILGSISSLTGGWDVPLNILLIIVLCDVLFGVGAALVSGEGFIPRKLVVGVTAKVGYFLAIVIAYQVDMALAYYSLTDAYFLHDATIIAFILADSISALANAVLMGIPVPDEVVKYIAKLKDFTKDTSPR